ncbi:YqhG family protein [Paenibacillus sp. CAU 1782]
MNEKQIHRFVGRFLEATGCSVIEKSPAHYMVKLSPQADRELTNRPYYWSFVDRVGSEPETMTFLYVTDKQRYDDASRTEAEAEAAPTGAGPGNGAAAPQGAADAALARSFGFVQNNLATGVRIPREDLYFGAGKLDRLFGAAKANGSYVCLFQEPERRGISPFNSTPYTAWLGVNIKVEFCCDRKREEIYSFGVSLATGNCVEQFYDMLTSRKLTPRLPANVHIAKNGISYAKALSIIEATLERKLKSQSYTWAQEASARLAEELERIDSYYTPIIENALDENKGAIQEQYRQRRAEIKWQYEPRVTASAINCGLFHLEGIH